MSVEYLGAPLTGVYSIPGGQARLYERGLTVNGAGGEVVVSFAFPMLGRPSIVTGQPAATPPFEPYAIHFHLGNWQLEQLTPLLQTALAGRLGLVMTGQPAVRVPLTIGPAAVVKPEQKPGVGGVTIPAVYGVSVTTAALQERQLYDVAVLADGGQWRIVAPHAVYRRETWTDFGIAHITDMHVARRIDLFRELLVRAGRAEAAQRMYNWNDRFRGFVRYANYLHGIGVLDVIVATGDLYDYLFEDNDNPADGGNAAFLRKLILGQAPGPDFPDVEELLVPIFMAPGNHDYRKHPYKLLFDVQISLIDLGILGSIDKDVMRIKNFSGYHLLQDDALLLTNRLDGHSGAEAPNLNPASAGRMVEVDTEIKPYKTFLADRGSYIVRLGAHRIAMLDSAHDVGLVTDVLKAFLVKIGFGSEDEATFVGGSPNCEGVSAEEFKMVSDALAETSDSGLFIVGLHAPLFNMWNNEYPYFLRETQRPAHHEQALAFLARHDGRPVQIKEQVQGRHPLWFASDQGAPTFVKRMESQDLHQDMLDYGVSRGKAEELMRLLAGIGSRRPADLVLAGHTHRHNEFSVRRLPTGELACYMDFYTQNPAWHYPTRFTHSWQRTADSPNTIAPVTDVTYVEIVSGAAPDATPWPMPYDAMFNNQLQAPPYQNPLSSTTNPRAWWAQHRPLVLQTGALGPLDNSQVSFTGFRVLLVKNDVIEKIHFIPTRRLEENQYRLAWEDAIRPTPIRRYLHVERSRPLKPPAAVGAPSGIVFPALGVTNVVYRDAEGRLHEVWQKGPESGTSNLTYLADNAIRAAGNPTLYIAATEGNEVALYRGTDSHVHSLYWSTGAVGRDALSLTAGAPPAAGNPVGFVQKDGTNVVIYRAGDKHLHSLWWTGTNAPGTEDLTAPSGAPPAAGDPAPFVNTNTGENIVVYRGTDGHIHVMYWLGAEAVAHESLSGFARSPKAAGDPVAYYTGHNDAHQVTYRSHDGHLHELWWLGANPVSHWDLTAATAGAPPAASDPAAYYSAGTNTKHVIYRSADGHLNEIWWIPGAMPTHVDITLEALAPLAVDKPTAFTVAGPDSHHAVYRGTDGQIHEIRWTSNVTFSGGAHVGLQSDWRWCNKCQGLFYGPTVGASKCPAGGPHASPAQSGSANYSLPHGVAGDVSRQSEWRWCNKCQGLFYGPAVATSRCPAGSAHAAPAQSGSVNYSLPMRL